MQDVVSKLHVPAKEKHKQLPVMVSNQNNIGIVLKCEREERQYTAQNEFHHEIEIKYWKKDCNLEFYIKCTIIHSKKNKYVINFCNLGVPCIVLSS